METKKRNVWIILAVIVVVLCCCALAFAGAGVGWFTTQAPDWAGSTSLQRERSEETYAVGDAPNLRIDNFAGNVIVRTGQSDAIRVAVTKKALRQDDLSRIEVDVSEQGGGLVIKTRAPSSLRNVSVDFEITAPPGTRLGADTGAGNVDIDGITSELDIHSGAGDLEVRGAASCAKMDTGAGSIRYEGTPQGECRFETGAGNITLALPAGLNVQVDLETGTGDIDVEFAVDGQVTRREVQGVIGSGAQGTIYAHTGAGNIDVVRR